eukprot:CAMPEP_0171383894 /NCGR_PEP_ID=MMETSP0879-20121228/37469_1 /TAXON_ID=67004 /ORGANISM="Thalassiosira weissflogii, Strain CCMP1336" /LENGTH=70 /DNA_ID=CAMNT_0011896035 /DNA_START=52 /DNA_END=264 /DNA_ORIENTATION=-
MMDLLHAVTSIEIRSVFSLKDDRSLLTAGAPSDVVDHSSPRMAYGVLDAIFMISTSGPKETFIMKSSSYW